MCQNLLFSGTGSTADATADATLASAEVLRVTTAVTSKLGEVKIWEDSKLGGIYKKGRFFFNSDTFTPAAMETSFPSVMDLCLCVALHGKDNSENYGKGWKHKQSTGQLIAFQGHNVVPGMKIDPTDCTSIVRAAKVKGAWAESMSNMLSSPLTKTRDIEETKNLLAEGYTGQRQTYEGNKEVWVNGQSESKISCTGNCIQHQEVNQRYNHCACDASDCDGGEKFYPNDPNCPEQETRL
jgi:hypothetical protein